MSYDETPFHEPFGPEYLRPAQPACPTCSCCSAPLCERGRADVLGCERHANDESRATVAHCPCSAESTHGTMAWHMGRIRAVSAAKTKPLPADAERLLRLVATEQPADDPHGLIPQLTMRRYVELVDDQPKLTQFGRLYLNARIETWAATAILVHDVDKATGMARVVVVRRDGNGTVDVPMYQLANPGTGLGVDELPGVMLHAYANVGAARDDDVILMGVSNPRLPEGYVPYANGGLGPAATPVAAEQATAGGEPAGGEG